MARYAFRWRVKHVLMSRPNEYEVFLRRIQAEDSEDARDLERRRRTGAYLVCSLPPVAMR
jgi:hypothetical protein